MNDKIKTLKSNLVRCSGFNLHQVRA